MSCGYFYSLLFIFGEIINILFKNKLNFKFKFTIKIFNYFKVIRWGCRPLSMLRPFNNNLDHIYFYISKWPWFVYYLTWSTIYNLFNNNSESKSLHWTSSQYITYNIKELLYQMIEEISGYKKNNIWAAGRSISESKTLGELEYITLYETCNILFIINLFIINIVHLFYFYKISAEIWLCDYARMLRPKNTRIHKSWTSRISSGRWAAARTIKIIKIKGKPPYPKWLKFLLGLILYIVYIKLVTSNETFKTLIIFILNNLHYILNFWLFLCFCYILLYVISLFLLELFYINKNLKIPTELHRYIISWLEGIQIYAQTKKDKIYLSNLYKKLIIMGLVVFIFGFFCA